MGKPPNSTRNGDIWHLSIDDLLAPLPDTTRLGGAGPFVINVSSSAAPICPPKDDIAGGHSAHLYQIRRVEDGRVRYRLRLGLFAREDDADALLANVREFYPGAMTATAGSDDLSAIAARPAQVGAPPPQSAPRAAEAASAKSTAPAAQPPGDVQTARRFAPRRIESTDMPARAIESTQTLRPLTPLELDDDAALRWYVVQLSISDQAVDPESLPNLDIFSLYRLYTVASLDQERVVHALRLGFFGAEIAARAVANYLSTYYEAASVKRVSVAERDRFADQRVEARKDVGATGKHAAIEITGELVVRPARSRGNRR